MANNGGSRLVGVMTGMLMGLANAHGLDYTLTYDANGNLTSRSVADHIRSHGYDVLDRLISDIRDGGVTGYEYDANGNRTLWSFDGVSTVYQYVSDSNRLEAIDGAGYGHDAAGNVLSDADGRVYEYNNAGRLHKVYAAQDPGTVIATYYYNAKGQRARKETDSGTVVYHYDLRGNLIGETDAAGAVHKAYVWDDAGAPIVQVDKASGSDRVVYLHTDHLQTPRHGSDLNGKLVWRWDGQAFGDIPALAEDDGSSAPVVVNLRFPGQYYDEETGLHYNWHRYYNPKTGRYISSDPIGLNGGFNTYLYALANPVAYKDPTGLFYTEARWLRGPSLSGISSHKLRDMGFGEYWTLVPPAVGIGGAWYLLAAQIRGTVECIEKGDCGNDKTDNFDVGVDLSAEVGIGYGITTLPRLQQLRRAASMFGSLGDAIKFYRNQWTQWTIEMAKDPLVWCFFWSATGGYSD
jgi:RHS repeat-associated protein